MSAGLTKEEDEAVDIAELNGLVNEENILLTGVKYENGRPPPLCLCFCVFLADWFLGILYLRRAKFERRLSSSQGQG